MEWRDVLMLFFLLWISGKAALLNVHFNTTFGQEQLLCWGELCDDFRYQLDAEKWMRHCSYQYGGVIDLNDFSIYGMRIRENSFGPIVHTSHVSACLLFMHKSEMFWQENVKRAIFQCNDPFWSDCHRAERKRKSQNRDQTMAMWWPCPPYLKKKVSSPSQCAWTQLDDFWTY